MTELIRAKEAVAIIGCHPSTFRWHVAKGNLEYAEKIQGTVYFKKEDVIYFSEHRPKPRNVKREDLPRKLKKKSPEKSISKEDLQAIHKRWQLHSKDRGSSEVLIGIYSNLIQEVEYRLNRTKIDDLQRREVRVDLLRYVGEKRRLLNYLKSTNEERYNKVIGMLEQDKRIA